MDNNKPQFYVGQTVYDDIRHPDRPGKVVRITSQSGYYPVGVVFDGQENTDSYTTDGRFMRRSIPTLMSTPYKAIIEPVEEPFKPGEIVEVRDGDDEWWRPRIFHGYNPAYKYGSRYQYLTVNYVRADGTLATTEWMQCRGANMGAILEKELQQATQKKEGAQVTFD